MSNKPMPRERWRHKKRGIVYTVVAFGNLQIEGPHDGTAMVVYRGDAGDVWCRPVAEFMDGRFELLSAESVLHLAPPPPAAEATYDPELAVPPAVSEAANHLRRLMVDSGLETAIIHGVKLVDYHLPPPAADAVAGMPQPYSPEWYVKQYEVCGRALARANGLDPDDVIADNHGTVWQWCAYYADHEFLHGAATLPAPRDTGDVTPEMMADALNDAWNEFCTDTGDFPDCFKLTKGPRLWANFHDGNFAALVAQYLNAARAFAALTARAEGDA